MTTPSIPHHPRKMWHQTPAKSASQWRSHGSKAKRHNLLSSNSFASTLWFSDSFHSTCILYTNIVSFFKVKHQQFQLRLRHGYCLTPSGTGIAMFRKQKTNCCPENEINCSWLPKTRFDRIGDQFTLFFLLGDSPQLKKEHRKQC